MPNSIEDDNELAHNTSNPQRRRSTRDCAHLHFHLSLFTGRLLPNPEPVGQTIAAEKLRFPRVLSDRGEVRIHANKRVSPCKLNF